MSNQNKEKDTPKKVEWKPNPNIQMDVKKGMDEWKPNTNIVMKIEETVQKKSKEQEEKK